MKDLARFLMICGGVLFAAGLVFWAAGKIPGLGKLPGDLYFRRGNFSFYFPLMTCFLISMVLTVLFNIFKKGNP